MIGIALLFVYGNDVVIIMGNSQQLTAFVFWPPAYCATHSSHGLW